MPDGVDEFFKVSPDDLGTGDSTVPGGQIGDFFNVVENDLPPVIEFGKEVLAVNEQHPELGTGGRFAVKNASSPQKAIEFLKGEGFEVKDIGESKDHNFAIKLPDETAFYVIDPRTDLIERVTSLGGATETLKDLAVDTAAAVIPGAATVAGATAGAALGSAVPGAGTVAGGLVGGALGAAGGFFAGDQAVEQGVNLAAGQTLESPGVGDVAEAAIVGPVSAALGPVAGRVLGAGGQVVAGTGRAAAGAARTAATNTLAKAAGIPRPAFLSRWLPKIDLLTRKGVVQGLGKVSEGRLFTKQLQEATENIVLRPNGEFLTATAQGSFLGEGFRMKAAEVATAIGLTELSDQILTPDPFVQQQAIVELDTALDDIEFLASKESSFDLPLSEMSSATVDDEDNILIEDVKDQQEIISTYRTKVSRGDLPVSHLAAQASMFNDTTTPNTLLPIPKKTSTREPTKRIRLKTGTAEKAAEYTY